MGDETVDLSAWSARGGSMGVSGIARWVAILLLVGACVFVMPGGVDFIMTFIGIMAAVFILILSIIRLWVCSLALLNVRQEKPDKLRDWQPQTWLRYTVLVPLYKEAHMVEGLVKALRNIDYPHDKLDIVLVTESDDSLTCQAVDKTLRKYPHIRFRMFQVPPSQPRTKPKALNAALAAIPAHLRGDLITIYDAEDRPHPLQLKAALRAFEEEPDLAAVQAPLGFYNDNKNLLTAFFGLEYAALFHVWNPGLARMGLPFTLGGTSNHIRRDILEAAGGWDPHNVTEDADLSFRISALGQSQYRVKIGWINTGTGEEAVATLRDWNNQRIRWLKGFLQTWCVHMRPKRTAPNGQKFYWRSRVRNMFALQITVGSTLLLSFLHIPSLLIITAIVLTNMFSMQEIPLHPVFYFLLVLGYGSAMLMNIIGALLAKKRHLVKFTPLIPLYWLLYFYPALLALWELIFAPSYWRKTRHRGRRETIQDAHASSHLAAE